MVLSITAFSNKLEKKSHKVWSDLLRQEIHLANKNYYSIIRTKCDLASFEKKIRA